MLKYLLGRLEASRTSKDLIVVATKNARSRTSLPSAMPQPMKRHGWESLQAMKRAADRLKEGSETDADGVVAVNNEFRARVQYSEYGEALEIKGPRRSSERRAKTDLELITAAGCDVPDRAERFEAMAKEARRLQDHAGYETEIAIALGQRQFDKQHMVKVIETDDEGDGDDESSDDPVPGYDVSTPQLCERLIQQTAVSPDKGKKTFTPKDPHDATVQNKRVK